MNEQRSQSIGEAKLTSVHSRYEVTGELTGAREVIDYFQTFEEARVRCKTALVQGYASPRIFDRHARKRAWQEWEVKPDGLYQVARR